MSDQPGRPTSAMQGGESDSPLPCPKCNYDLRGQTTPRCSECGMEFASLEDLAEVSRRSLRVYTLVVRWRIRVTAGVIVGMMLTPLARWAASDNPTWGQVLTALLIVLPAVGALVLLNRVERWHRDPRVRGRGRQVADSTVPLLLLLASPGMLLGATLLLRLVS